MCRYSGEKIMNNYDVIIAGSGAAGRYAAINLPETLKVLVI